MSSKVTCIIWLTRPSGNVKDAKCLELTSRAGGLHYDVLDSSLYVGLYQDSTNDNMSVYKMKTSNGVLERDYMFYFENTDGNNFGFVGDFCDG